MKKSVFGLLAATIALAAYGEIPTSASGWYTPNEFKHTVSSGVVYYYNDDGDFAYADIDVDENGDVVGIFAMDEDSVAYPAYQALVRALKAETLAQRNTDRIETIGKNLDSVFRAEGIKMEMEKQGPGGSSTRVTYTMRINPGSNGGAASIEASDPTPYGGIVDGKTIAWTAENASGQLQLYGAKTATSSTADIWDGRGFVVPFIEGSSALGWKRFGGVNNLVFEKHADGGGNWELTLKNFHDPAAANSLSALLTDGSTAFARGSYYIVSRYGTGNNATLHYLPIGDLISAKGAPPDDVTMTTNTAHGAVLADILSLYGWTTSGGVDSLADFLTVDKGAPGYDMPTYEVLARCTDGDDVSLEYLALGNLHGVTWATNWTEAVEHITKEETIQIVSFVTNIFTHENFITNVIDKYSSISNFENFVTFQTNMFNNVNVITNLINNVQSIENWTYVTNYIVRYLGGTYDPGGDGGDGDGGPTIAPEDDPYSEEYVPQEIDDYLLPVKNARNIVAITNAPFSMIDATMMLDFQSIDTNKSWLAQLYGFEEAQEGTTPVKQSDGDGGYKLEWVEHPAELLAITTNGIAEIKQWMVRNNFTNIFTSVVSNSEALATMRTNLFAHVKAETLLDNESVWTNNVGRVEVKGYKAASPYKVPFTDLDSDSKVMVWEPLPFADDDARERFNSTDIPSTISVRDETTDASTNGMKVLTLYGFDDANIGTVPVKSSHPVNHDTFAIRWSYPRSGAFSYDNGEILVGAVTVGRRAYRVNGLSNVTNGLYRVKVELDQYGGTNHTFTVEKGDGFAAPPSRTTSYFPLYSISDGAVYEDYRGTFVVPAYETGGSN